MNGAMGGERTGVHSQSVIVPPQLPHINGEKSVNGSFSGEESVNHGKWLKVALNALENYCGDLFLTWNLNKYTRPFIMNKMVPTLMVGCVGLGRMGKRHAYHFLEMIEGASLVAVCSPDPEERDWAAKHLAGKIVTIYETFEQLLGHEGLQAVVIASVTTVHAEQAIKAIEAGKHVLCEKPLSLTPEVVSLPGRSAMRMLIV